MRAAFFDKAKCFTLTVAAVLLLALSAGACGAGGEDGGSTVFEAPSREDFGELSWTEAFDAMHDKISREYAFTQWRGIDWDALYSEFRPLAAQAEADGSLEDYLISLRKYTCALQDGHVRVDGEDSGLMDGLYGGGFGMTVETLDDGRTIANWVKEGGPAASAGLQAGAEIVTWDSKPIADALAETDTFMSLYPPATDEMVGCMQRFFLTRAPAGTDVSLSCVNPGGAAVSATLTAVADSMETLDHAYSLVGFPPEGNAGGVTRMVTTRTLPGGYGYIKIEGEYDLPAGSQGDHTPTLELYREAVGGFADAGAPGLVIDVRSNDGGSDRMVADMMSCLYSESAFYEYQNWYNAGSGSLEIILVNENTGRFEDPGAGITITPSSPAFTGPVVALVNPACISSGEGIAMCVGRLPRGEVVGFHGTNGSFGMVYGALIEMPGGYSVTYPTGQSLDESKAVQLESRGGEGGVAPTVRVPLTAENAVRAANGEDVELEYALELLQSMANE